MVYESVSLLFYIRPAVPQWDDPAGGRCIALLEELFPYGNKSLAKNSKLNHEDTESRSFFIGLLSVFVSLWFNKLNRHDSCSLMQEDGSAVAKNPMAFSRKLDKR
jgi:hypothetical protein